MLVGKGWAYDDPVAEYQVTSDRAQSTIMSPGGRGVENVGLAGTKSQTSPTASGATLVILNRRPRSLCVWNSRHSVLSFGEYGLRTISGWLYRSDPIRRRADVTARLRWASKGTAAGRRSEPLVLKRRKGKRGVAKRFAGLAESIEYSRPQRAGVWRACPRRAWHTTCF